MQTVLIVDDNDAVRTALDMLFSLHDLHVVAASDGEEALACLERTSVDLVVQDMNFTEDTTSGEEGIELFRRVREREPDLPVILLTAWTDLETAVELVKAGAADYVAKPWDDIKLMTTARNLLELREASQHSRQLSASRRAARNKLAERFSLCGIVYESESMHELVSLATRIAHADVPVLITGPNGAGKEKLAEIVQANSANPDGPFIKTNVGALPAELMEAELFGAQAGAFTGAQSAREGRFEAADGGTLFLDEIGNLSLDGQAKLLRVLQTGEFERLGSSETRRVNVRVISATNADLPEAVRAGSFREDLFYRLNVIQLELPPLVERAEDVLPLAIHFIDGSSTLTPEAERALTQHTWPGNVRELQNSLRRAVLLAQDGRISEADLQLVSTAPAPVSHGSEPDREQILAALESARGVVARAARRLGMSRQALYRRMEKFGIQK
ncbi:MAG: sigma-54-dependent transcriptional regulator [Gammaproteobacteria bacterium]